MAYASIEFKHKKLLKEAVASGKQISVYSLGPLAVIKMGLK